LSSSKYGTDIYIIKLHIIYFHPWSQDLAFLLGSLAFPTIFGESFAWAFSTRDATSEASAACAPAAAAARKRGRAAGREEQLGTGKERGGSCRTAAMEAAAAAGRER
jgi:hypothetical protein